MEETDEVSTASLEDEYTGQHEDEILKYIIQTHLTEKQARRHILRGFKSGCRFGTGRHPARSYRSEQYREPIQSHADCGCHYEQSRQQGKVTDSYSTPCSSWAVRVFPDICSPKGSAFSKSEPSNSFAHLSQIFIRKMQVFSFSPFRSADLSTPHKASHVLFSSKGLTDL